MLHLVIPSVTGYEEPMKNRLKQDDGRVAKTSISLTKPLYNFALQKMKDQGFSSLSGYLQALVRQDAGQNLTASAR